MQKWIDGMYRPRPLTSKRSKSIRNLLFQDQAQLESWNGHSNTNCFTIFFFVSFPVPWLCMSRHVPPDFNTKNHTNPYPSSKFSYKILNPKAAEAEKDPMKVAQVILEASGLDTESYRLGNTKAWVPTVFRTFHTISICLRTRDVFLYFIFVCWPFLNVTLCLVNRGQTSMNKTRPLVLPNYNYYTARSDTHPPTYEFLVNHWIRIQQESPIFPYTNLSIGYSIFPQPAFKIDTAINHPITCFNTNFTINADTKSSA